MEFQSSNVINRCHFGGEIILNKKYLLYGYGITNQSLERFFIKNKVSYQILKNANDLTDLKNIDIIIKSPGIPFNTPLLSKAKEKNKKVISDIELFSILYPSAIIIAVTGTNGKTTTILMLKALLEKKYNVYLGGNIGIPLFDLESIKNFMNEIVLIECSSYMLASTYKFHPQISIITNIYPNHLDHHPSFLHYVESKFKIIKNMNSNDYLIYSSELDDYDEIKNFKGRKIAINQTNIIDDELIKIKFPELHNQINFKMALATSSLFKINNEQVLEVLQSFKIPDYRLEKIYHNDNLIIYNDSKSTNFLSLIKAVEFLKNEEFQLYWIAGGLDRREDWYQLNKELKCFSGAYLYGENRYKIAEVLDSISVNYIVKDTLIDVIGIMPTNFKEKTCILFSPASPSTDQFKNYLERGEVFEKTILNHLRIGKI